MSGGFLAVQAKRTKERNKKVNLEDAFKEADTNNDGALTLEEWTEVLSKTGQDNPRLVLLVRGSCNSFAWILSGLEITVRGLVTFPFKSCVSQLSVDQISRNFVYF